MARVEGEIIINRPVQEVFDFVAAERNEPRYNSGMVEAVKISEGPIGLGTQFETELKTMGRTMPMTVEHRPRATLAPRVVHALIDDGDRGCPDVRVGSR
jgi:hypothetical protein